MLTTAFQQSSCRIASLNSEHRHHGLFAEAKSGSIETWLRGIKNLSKAYTVKCAAYNLGLLLRKAFGMRKPRNAEEGGAGLF